SLPLLNIPTKVLIAEVQGQKVLATSVRNTGARFFPNHVLPVEPAQLSFVSQTADSSFRLHTAQGTILQAVARKIEGTPWFLVTMIDQNAIRKNITSLAWIVAIIGLGVLGMLWAAA